VVDRGRGKVVDTVEQIKVSKISGIFGRVYMVSSGINRINRKIEPGKWGRPVTPRFYKLRNGELLDVTFMQELVSNSRRLMKKQCKRMEDR